MTKTYLNIKEIPVCNGECMCGKSNEEKPTQKLVASMEDLNLAYDEGYADGFRDARHTFWAELRIKSGDSRMIARKLEESGDDLNSDAFTVAEAVYFNAAEAILRGRRDFPGYMEDGEPSDSWHSEDHEEEELEENNNGSCGCS